MSRFISSDISKTSLLTAKQKRLFCWTLLFASLLLATSNGIAANSSTSPQPPATPADVEIFEYQLEDRADPFVPFITPKAAASTIDMNEIIDENTPLTGMQLFEPGQLTLVALLKSGLEEMAMVQDFTGKGYMLTEGIKIGKRGVVKDITSNRVIIEETAETRAGKKIVTEVVMILKKEGEE